MDNMIDTPDDIITEKIINNRKRVRSHGEVFTPSRIVKKMLSLPSIKEACEDLTATFLEPGAGEGAFLVEILKRKLRIVERFHGEPLKRYENYALLALSTLYGIELLDDNVKSCVQKLNRTFYDAYLKQLEKHGRRAKPSVLSSADLIITKNIVQGDFLKKLSSTGKPVVLSEWRVLNLTDYPVILNVQRTEYTLEEIEHDVSKRAGARVNSSEPKQLSLPISGFSENHEEEHRVVFSGRFAPCSITSVYREELIDVE